MITKFDEFLNESRGQNREERREKKKNDRKRDKERRSEKWRGGYKGRRPTVLTKVKKEKEKERRKEISKYLSKDEMDKMKERELTDNQVSSLLNRRKYHGSMNDDDLVNNQITYNKTLISDYNLQKKIEEQED